MAAHIFIGTSGWNYAGWNDDFYTGVPRKWWLEYYSERFNALEVDGTFYHLPSENVAKSWYERTPADFHFAIKGHRYITHIKRLEPPNHSSSNAIVRRHWGRNSSAMLWQLPPNLHKDMHRLAAFIAMLAMWPEVRHVIEFRDQSWFDDEVAALMTHERIALCQSDAATWPMWRAITTDLVFIRRHGHAATYASNYDRDSLEQWAKGIRQWSRDRRDVHIYFDNDAKGYAPWNALTLANILGLTRKGRDQSEFFFTKRRTGVRPA